MPTESKRVCERNHDIIITSVSFCCALIEHLALRLNLIFFYMGTQHAFFFQYVVYSFIDEAGISS